MTTEYKKASEFLTPNSSQKNITIPEGVEEIDFNFFNDCSNIETVSFPSTLKVIGSWAFSGCTNLREAIIPNGVEEIDIEAFSACRNLREVILPRTLKKIGDGAFSLCHSLEKITIPGSVNNLGMSIFSSSSLKEVVIEEGVRVIDRLAFFMSHELERITFPRTIEMIEVNAFEDCNSLKEVTVPIKVFFGLRLYGIKPFNNQNIKFNITYDDINEFNHYYLSNPDIIKDYQLKGNISFNSLKKQNPEPIEYDFPFLIKTIQREDLNERVLSSTSLELPEGIEIIDEGTFRNLKNLKKIKLPSTLKEIRTSAFEGCTSLEEIIIPEGTTLLGDWAFYRCENLKRVTLPNSLETLNKNVFSECHSLESITLPVTSKILKRILEGNEYFGITSFMNVNYRNHNDYTAGMERNVPIINVEYTDPLECVNFIAKYIDYFSNYIYRFNFVEKGKLQNQTLEEPKPDELVKKPEKKIVLSRNDIGNNPSYLTRFEIPEGITKIDPQTFKDCMELTTITIPRTVKAIGVSAFANCVSLKKIIFNEGLEEIEENAFTGCASLEEINFPSTLRSIGLEAFSHCKNLKSLILPEGLLQMYSSYYNEDINNITIPGSLMIVPPDFLYSASNLKEITVNEGIEKISSNAFSRCSSLETVHLPSTLKTIEHAAFFGCTALKSIELPEGLEKIGDLVFSDCKNLTEIKLPSTLKKLVDTQFLNCDSLKRIKISTNLKMSYGALTSIESLDEVIVEYPSFNELYNFVSKNKEELNHYFLKKGPGRILFVGPKLNVLETFKLGLLFDSKAYTLIEEVKKEIPVEETPPTIPEEVIPFVTGDIEIDTLINNIHKLSTYLSPETQQEIEGQITRIINKYNEAKKEFEPKLEDSLKKYNLHFGTPETVRLNTISELETIIINLSGIKKYNASFEKLDYYRKLANGGPKAKEENDFIADDIRSILITLNKFPKEYKEKKQQELFTILDDLENLIRDDIDTLFDSNLLTNPKEIDYRSILAIKIAKLREQITKEHKCFVKYLALINTLRIRDNEIRLGDYPVEDLSELRRIINLLPISPFRDELKKEYIEFTDECIQEILDAIKSNECYTLTKYDEIIRKIRAKIIVLGTKINNREVKNPFLKMAEELEHTEPDSIHSKRDLLNQLEICKGIILTRRAVEPLTMLSTRAIEKKILEFYNKVLNSPYLTEEYKERLLFYLTSVIEQQKRLTSNSNASIYNNFLLDHLFNSISELEMILFDYEVEKREYDKGFKS